LLTEKQKANIQNINNCSPNLRRSIRKRVSDKTIQSIEDLTLIFQHAEEFPTLKEKIPFENIQKLVDSYFEAYKIGPEFSNPKKVLEILDENVTLKRKNATLMQELGDMVHRVEHFKYLANHATMLREKDSKLQQEGIIMP